MANQLLREGVWSSRKLRGCALDAHLAFSYLLPIADYWGRFEYDPRAIWAKVGASRADISQKTLQGWLDELEAAGLFARYGEGGKYAAWLNFKGMPASKRGPSKCPAPPFDNSDGTLGVPSPYPEGTLTAPKGTSVVVVGNVVVVGDEDSDAKGTLGVPSPSPRRSASQLSGRCVEAFNNLHRTKRRVTPALVSHVRDALTADPPYSPDDILAAVCVSGEDEWYATRDVSMPLHFKAGTKGRKAHLDDLLAKIAPGERFTPAVATEVKRLGLAGYFKERVGAADGDGTDGSGAPGS